MRWELLTIIIIIHHTSATNQIQSCNGKGTPLEPDNQQRVDMKWDCHEMSRVYPIKYAHGFVVFCYGRWLHNQMSTELCGLLIHVLHECFTGTGAIIWLPSASEAILRDVGKISLHITMATHELCTYFLGCALLTALWFWKDEPDNNKEANG